MSSALMTGRCLSFAAELPCGIRQFTRKGAGGEDVFIVALLTHRRLRQYGHLTVWRHPETLNIANASR